MTVLFTRTNLLGEWCYIGIHFSLLILIQFCIYLVMENGFIDLMMASNRHVRTRGKESRRESLVLYELIDTQTREEWGRRNVYYNKRWCRKILVFHGLCSIVSLAFVALENRWWKKRDRCAWVPAQQGGIKVALMRALTCVDTRCWPWLWLMIGRADLALFRGGMRSIISGPRVYTGDT